jgi:transcriptional regulator with XRE-family HTH domain
MLDIEKMESLRAKLGLTQEEAAERAGLAGGKRHWNDIVNGRKSNVTMQTLDQIADALECRARDLVK